MKPADGLAAAERELDAIVHRFPRSVRSCGSSREHERISKLRADHDRVSKAEIERALFRAGLASEGEQSEAARVIGVSEGAVRHWRDLTMTASLPPRVAIEKLHAYAQNHKPARKVAGVK